VKEDSDQGDRRQKLSVRECVRDEEVGTIWVKVFALNQF
jgi:hypothetical protein